MNVDPEHIDRAQQEKLWRTQMVASQQGDQAAYERLLTGLLPMLRRIVGRKWRSAQDVEDIVQDVLLSMHSVRHTYDPGRPFMPWLMTITSRRIADAARRATSRSANETTVENFPETSGEAETKNEQERSDDQKMLLEAISQLSDGQREAVELMKVHGLTLEEASRKTGKSVAALKVTVHRAMKSMRQSIEEKS